MMERAVVDKLKMMERAVVDLKKLNDLTCTCGEKEFVPVFQLKVLPPLLSPTGNQEFIQVTRWKCNVCGALVPIKIQ